MDRRGVPGRRHRLPRLVRAICHADIKSYGHPDGWADATTDAVADRRTYARTDARTNGAYGRAYDWADGSADCRTDCRTYTTTDAMADASAVVVHGKAVRRRGRAPQKKASTTTTTPPLLHDRPIYPDANKRALTAPIPYRPLDGRRTDAAVRVVLPCSDVPPFFANV